MRSRHYRQTTSMKACSGARGIAVNTVAPGAIETDFGGGGARDNPEINKLFADMTALGRAGLTEPTLERRPSHACWHEI